MPLIKPYLNEKVKQGVLDVLESGMWTEGTVTHEFETAIARYCGVEHCLAVTSCTTGLEMTLRCLGIGPGDEVIVPDYTYPATALAVNNVGATAVIVDVDPATLLIDYDALAAANTPKTKAAIPVSLFGNPLDWDRLNNIKEQYNIFMVEDAACAMGSSYKGEKTGSWADITVFSHHPRKFITTGEGGTVATNNKEWAEWMQSYKHFGMAPAVEGQGTQFNQLGTNLKLSNILAAVGLAQMKEIGMLLKERCRLAEHYMALIKKIPGVTLPKLTPGGEHSWQTLCILVQGRDRLIAALREQNIEAQIGTYALHMHRVFRKNPLCRITGDMPGSYAAFARTLALPLYHGMSETEQKQIVAALLQ